ncbi:MAG: NADH-quinone oxidoreductase subunit NuoH [Acidimicrobiales bacterium]|nr:NADH-quinone oxidoreductase subunit NuoH [Acidimicrobiales bacterium]
MILSGLDPLFLGDAGTFEMLLIVILKVLVAFSLLLVSVMLYIWWMRKFIGAMQNRIGPSRAGPFGILQTLADGIKLFFKEDLIPNKSDRFVFKLAPFFSIVPALLVFCVVPVAGDFSGDGDGTVTWFGNETFVQVADPHIGILFVLAMSSIAVYGIMLAGWSSGSKYPLLGSVRASAQMVSYEAALGLALVAVLLKTGTLSTHDIALQQSNGLPDWGLVVTGFIPFFIFFIATTAELNSPPFDLVEAEQELVGGFHTEYSSIRFALFFMAEFMNVITMSAVMVTLFFGGPGGYYPNFGPAWLWGLLWFAGKVFIFVSVFVWMRGTLPRPRYDQLMDLGWKVLIPLALGWVLLLATLDVFDDRGHGGWLTRIFVVLICIAVIIFFAALLNSAILKGQRRRDRDGEEAFG